MIISNFFLVGWQKDFIASSRNKKYVILSSSTGSGKTICYETWAFDKLERPIFITSPIKSLSNQRFRELTAKGYKVGLETGDIKYFPSENVDIICCTQEIYDQKYRDYENSTLIVDEFSYIFENPDRTRCYIDSLRFSKASNILVCSGTFGNPKKVKEYLDRLTGIDFYLYENSKRLTELEYRDEILIKDIRNSFVVSYSTDDCRMIAFSLYNYRKSSGEIELYFGNSDKIKALARKYNVRNDELIELATMGVVYYFGKLYPKEKMFIEELFEKRLIDTVVGTDALAMGVNFPIENVVFTSFIKKGSGKKGLISKNLFSQLSGRAGRKKYFDKGYVYWCGEFDKKNREKIKGSYYKLLESSQEDFCINMRAKIGDILAGKITVEEEAWYVTNFSTDGKCYEEVRSKIQSIVDFITTLDIRAYMLNRMYNIDVYSGFDGTIDGFGKSARRKIESLSKRLVKLQRVFDKDISFVYFDEYSFEENCDLFIEILLGTSLEELIKRYCCSMQKVDMRKLTQLRKYLYGLPSNYSFGYDLEALDRFIDKIDSTILHPYGSVSSDLEDDLEVDYSLLRNDGDFFPARDSRHQRYNSGR